MFQYIQHFNIIYSYNLKYKTSVIKFIHIVEVMELRNFLTV